LFAKCNELIKIKRKIVIFFLQWLKYSLRGRIRVFKRRKAAPINSGRRQVQEAMGLGKMKKDVLIHILFLSV